MRVAKINLHDYSRALKLTTAWHISHTAAPVSRISVCGNFGGHGEAWLSYLSRRFNFHRFHAITPSQYGTQYRLQDDVARFKTPSVVLTATQCCSSVASRLTKE